MQVYRYDPVMVHIQSPLMCPVTITVFHTYQRLNWVSVKNRRLNQGLENGHPKLSRSQVPMPMKTW